MIVVSNNDMAAIMASSNDIAMIIIITVMNGVVFLKLGIAPSMVSLTAITTVEVSVRGAMMVVVIEITILRMLLLTLITIIIRNEGERMIVLSINDMAIIMKSSNDIAMILVIPVTNEVVVHPMGVTPSMVSLTAITVVGVAGW